MSKETMERIREAEAEADRRIAAAEAEAARMRAAADAAGRERCAKAENAAGDALAAALNAAQQQADRLTEQALAAAKAEAETVRKNAEGRLSEAEKIVIGGLEAKCR